MGLRQRTSLIMSCSSASVGFWPSDRITVPNSLVVTVPVTTSHAQAPPGGRQTLAAARAGARRRQAKAKARLVPAPTTARPGQQAGRLREARTVAILVEQGKRLLELRNLLVCIGRKHRVPSMSGHCPVSGT